MGAFCCLKDIGGGYSLERNIKVEKLMVVIMGRDSREADGCFAPLNLL